MTRTKELAEVVAAATPVKTTKHPATRTFVRCASANRGTGGDRAGAKSSLSTGPVRAAFQSSVSTSLEDRIVKRFMREQSRGSAGTGGIPMTEAQLKKLGGRESYER